LKQIKTVTPSQLIVLQATLLCPESEQSEDILGFFLKHLPELAFAVSRYACPTSGFSRRGPWEPYTSLEDIGYGSLEQDKEGCTLLLSHLLHVSLIFLTDFWWSLVCLIPRKGSSLSYIGKSNLCKERLLDSLL